MSVETLAEISTINGIVEGRIAPESLPFARLSADEQAAVITAIDEVVEDLEVSRDVLKRYPLLDCPVQRAERIREYKREYISRTEDSLRAAAASYFDAVTGVLIRDGATSRSYTIDSSGVVEFAGS